MRTRTLFVALLAAAALVVLGGLTLAYQDTATVTQTSDTQTSGDITARAHVPAIATNAPGGYGAAKYESLNTGYDVHGPMTTGAGALVPTTPSPCVGRRTALPRIRCRSPGSERAW